MKEQLEYAIANPICRHCQVSYLGHTVRGAGIAVEEMCDGTREGFIETNAPLPPSPKLPAYRCEISRPIGTFQWRIDLYRSMDGTFGDHATGRHLTIHTLEKDQADAFRKFFA